MLANAPIQTNPVWDEEPSLFVAMVMVTYPAEPCYGGSTGDGDPKTRATRLRKLEVVSSRAPPRHTMKLHLLDEWRGVETLTTSMPA